MLLNQLTANIVDAIIRATIASNLRFEVSTQQIINAIYPDAADHYDAQACYLRLLTDLIPDICQWI